MASHDTKYTRPLHYATALLECVYNKTLASFHHNNSSNKQVTVDDSASRGICYSEMKNQFVQIHINMKAVNIK